MDKYFCLFIYTSATEMESKLSTLTESKRFVSVLSVGLIDPGITEQEIVYCHLLYKNF